MNERHAIIVVDLAFGDCGKGTIIDYLARDRQGSLCPAHAVVRFNGGPQAAHNVVTADGRHHTFAQFGAGSFVPGVRTLLSRFVLIEPYSLFKEAEHLQAIGVADPMGRLIIDARCPIITPPHQAANRLRELARALAVGGAHGTCGMGVGETMGDLLERPRLMLHAADLSDRAMVARKLRALCDLKIDQLRNEISAVRAHPAALASARTLLEPQWIDAAVDNYAELARRVTIADESAVASALNLPGTILLEGAQGVLLDEWFGFHPHTTWSTTTFANAETVLKEIGFAGEKTRLGVLRSYFTRHGAGPMVTEDAALSPGLPEPHNGASGWQGNFRVGAFDAVAARYALAIAGGVDRLVVTHLDRLRQLPARICTSYRYEASREATGQLEASWLDECFTRNPSDPEVLRDIRVHRNNIDLDRQEKLTRLLGQCRAQYSDFGDGNGDGDEEAFLEFLERELGVSVGLTSHGLTAADKRVRASMP